MHPEAAVSDFEISGRGILQCTVSLYPFLSHFLSLSFSLPSAISLPPRRFSAGKARSSALFLPAAFKEDRIIHAAE